MKIPEPVSGILKTLGAAGFEAWLVGGCVRDMLLHKQPHDYDIATAARPEQVQALFPHTVPTGLRYGTVTVLTGGVPEKAEVTAFRSEEGYRDRRRPDTVRFGGSLRADLSRRDFTVNAMAFHPQRGLCDPFGGRDDLKARIIRTVGDPAARFAEDALRVLRAFRFSAVLGFAIEPSTLAAARDAAPLVRAVSGERVRDELQRILLSARPQTVFALIDAGIDCGVFRAAGSGLPDIPGKTERPFDRSRLAAAPASPGARWAGFFALLGADGNETARLCRALKMDNATASAARLLLAVIAAPAPGSPADVRRALAETPPALLREGFLLWGALLGRDPAPRCALLDGVLRRGEAYCIPMLAVGGRDLLALGFTGPVCGGVLRRLLALVVENPDLNERTVLLHLAAETALQQGVPSGGEVCPGL